MRRRMQQLTGSLFKTFFEDQDNFLFDCDGVLWHGNTILPGAAECLSLLKKLGKKVFYVTNNSNSTRSQYAEKCEKLGLPATEADIVCTAHSSAFYLKEILKPSANYRPKVYVVGNPAIVSELNAVGIDGIGAEADPVPEDFTQSSPTKVTLESGVKAVLVGFDKNISYLKMLKAASYLRDQNVPFVATNQDKTFPVSSSQIVVPGTGSIVASVQTAAGRDPVVVGKPSQLMINILKKENHLDTSKSVFFGDRLDTDIAVANRCGMKSIFVLSGVSTFVEAENAKKNNRKEDSDLVPTFFIDSIDVFYQLLLLHSP